MTLFLANPANPANPANSADPANSANPADSADPANSVEAADPVDPADLVDLVDPAEMMASDGSGVAAFERGDYGAALADLSVAAKAGDSRAQLYLGHIYSQAESELANPAEALFWLSCAATSDGVSASARELLLRLVDGLKDAGGVRATRSCPPPSTAVSDFDASRFVVETLDSVRRHYPNRLGKVERNIANRRGKVKKSIVTKIRENGFGSFFMLPGEATIEVGHRAARAVGAKTVAYYVDEARQPGNDMAYLLVVVLSWLLLFKVVMIVVSIASRVGPSGISINADQAKRVDRKFLGGPK